LIRVKTPAEALALPPLLSDPVAPPEEVYFEGSSDVEDFVESEVFKKASESVQAAFRRTLAGVMEAEKRLANAHPAQVENYQRSHANSLKKARNTIATLSRSKAPKVSKAAKEDPNQISKLGPSDTTAINLGSSKVDLSPEMAVSADVEEFLTAHNPSGIATLEKLRAEVNDGRRVPPRMLRALVAKVIEAVTKKNAGKPNRKQKIDNDYQELFPEAFYGEINKPVEKVHDGVPERDWSAELRQKLQVQNILEQVDV
jgi:Arc/MetJ-type ribon-helix-helix transcriptional regulator